MPPEIVKAWRSVLPKAKQLFPVGGVTPNASRPTGEPAPTASASVGALPARRDALGGRAGGDGVCRGLARGGVRGKVPDGSPRIGRKTMQTELPFDLPAVRIMTVTASDTWSFSATGQWTNDCIRCGPDGYRNFSRRAADGASCQRYGPPARGLRATTDWTLSSEAKRYIENSVIATTPAATRKRMSRRSKRWSKRFGDEASRTKRPLQMSDLQMRQIGVTLDHGFVIRASSGSKFRLEPSSSEYSCRVRARTDRLRYAFVTKLATV